MLSDLLPPQLRNCLNKLGSDRRVHLHFTSRTAAVSKNRVPHRQHHSGASVTSWVWKLPSLLAQVLCVPALPGKGRGTEHRTICSVPVPTLLPKGWSRPHPARSRGWRQAELRAVREQPCGGRDPQLREAGCLWGGEQGERLPLQQASPGQQAKTPLLPSASPSPSLQVNCPAAWGDGASCGSPRLSDLQTASSAPAPKCQWYIPALKACLRSDCPTAAQGHFPCPEAGGLQQPGITWGDTWSMKQGAMDFPPPYGQPLALWDRARTHWSRKVFGFTVALDQGGWKGGF